MISSGKLERRGRTWVFGDNINTDLIFPNAAFRLPEGEQHRLVFSANRPGWVDEVAPGDLLVGGHNFGMGSGRPVGRLLRSCGITGVAVESINAIALRNCVNYGMPALVCPGVTKLVRESDEIEIDYDAGVLRNHSTGKELFGKPLPQLLKGLVMAGGVIPMLVAEGFIEASPAIASPT